MEEPAYRGGYQVRVEVFGVTNLAGAKSIDKMCRRERQIPACFELNCCRRMCHDKWMVVTMWCIGQLSWASVAQKLTFALGVSVVQRQEWASTATGVVVSSELEVRSERFEQQLPNDKACRRVNLRRVFGSGPTAEQRRVCSDVSSEVEQRRLRNLIRVCSEVGGKAEQHRVCSGVSSKVKQRRRCWFSQHLCGVFKPRGEQKKKLRNCGPESTLVAPIKVAGHMVNCRHLLLII